MAVTATAFGEVASNVSGPTATTADTGAEAMRVRKRSGVDGRRRVGERVDRRIGPELLGRQRPVHGGLRHGPDGGGGRGHAGQLVRDAV